MNADDFGLSRSVNRGIIDCVEQGIVTSASLMVRQPAAAEAADYARRNPRLSTGLHVDLGEWECRRGDWQPVYEVVPVDDPRRVAEEIERQLDAFRKLLGRDPSHLDSHQHVHQKDPSRSAFSPVARRLGIPLRGCNTRVQYCGDFYGQDAEGASLPGAISIENLERILRSLPGGATELGCHPGYVGDLKSAYLYERPDEVRVLCAARLQDKLRECAIELRSFDNLPGIWQV